MIMGIQDTISPEDRILEVVKTSLLVLGGLGVILPVYLSSWQAIENNRVINDKIVFDKTQNSFHLIDKWDDQALTEARNYIRVLIEKRVSLSDEQMIAEINAKPELKRSLLLLFNYWEKIRLSIVYERVNEEMLKFAFKEAYLRLFPLFRPWLQSNDVTPSFLEDLKKLYDAWYSDNRVKL